MIIFKDKALTEAINEKEPYDFEVVRTGEVKEQVLFVQNNTNAFLESIKVKYNDTEVKIAGFPLKMNPNEVVEFKLIWSPQASLKAGLKESIEIEYDEIWKP